MQNKKVLLTAIALVLVAALMLGVYMLCKPKAVEGAKTISVQIVNNHSDKTVAISTDAEYLRGALEQQKLVAGDESEYGLFVKTVDGYTVNDANQEWWCFTKGGEMMTTGIDTTPIADGDHYEITMTVGY